jgi:hypothetical protein
MSYNGMPKYMPNVLEWLRQTEPVVNGLMQGKSNNYGSVTLTANAASTTVTESAGRISSNAVILFMPTTANAAVANQTMYVSATAPNSNTFTITHANNAQTDRTFRYVIIG